ncbi:MULTISPECIES: FHA domain-containing protein [Polyangium]|uniref:FHA domain-containing protein n=2 Tax=Polyangium TaxID=55 RepID=A0A4U1JDF2_9BACT|nr:MULTISPECIES: FHA domain-containing protein [Polyangium]MDI1428016.1 FHA domain-containing protein [Polyangium sorediatum]TKD06631.1 FHA domain-containing protein [Polyangium fumosum]
MAVRLRYLSHELEVPLGQFVIGRSADCQLALDDPLVSRRHALLTVRGDSVTIEDLGSRNGVSLNGTKIEGPQKLAHGDHITIGGQEMVLENIPEEGLSSVPESIAFGHPRSAARSARMPTVAGHEGFETREDFWSDYTTPGVASQQNTSPTPSVNSANIVAAANVQPDRHVNALSLIGSVADKALAMGRAEEAERILLRSLNDVLQKARDGKEPPLDLASTAAIYAAKLASATGRGLWIDYIFELYTRIDQLVPGTVVDELYSAVRKVKTLDMGKMRAYTESLRSRSSSFGPSERFVQQRIEGLERLGGLK